MLICGPVLGLAQVNKIIGSVRGNTGSVLSAVTVRMIIDIDTLSTYTDSLGKFSFPAPETLKFKLHLSTLGYFSFTQTYQLQTEKPEMELGVLVLKYDPYMLDQVEIKGKLKRITAKTDTIEYKALAYSVLPADLVSKLQIIDDHGDQAAFTGNKTGIRPTKILNLVTKSGKNQVRFGQIKIGLGTNRRYGMEGAVNYWQGNKQVSLNAKLNRADNGAGTDDEKAAGITYWDSLGKQIEGNLQVRLHVQRFLVLRYQVR